MKLIYKNKTLYKSKNRDYRYKDHLFTGIKKE